MGVVGSRLKMAKARARDHCRGGTHLPWTSCFQQKDRSSEELGALPSPPNKQLQQELNQIFGHHVQCFLHRGDCCHFY